MIDIQIKATIDSLQRIHTEMIRQHSRLVDRRCILDTITTLKRLEREMR